jgi:hypothetical protein
MSGVAEKPDVTPEELLGMRDWKDFELVDVRLVERKGSALSSWVGGNILGEIGNFCVDPMKMGWVFSASLGLQCFSDRSNTVRRCSVTFLKAGRMSWDKLTDGWLRLVPDLIVDVIAPSHLAYEVDAKVEMFLKAGVPLIWVVHPNVRTIRILRGDGSAATLREGDELSGEDVLPGFTCPVASIFPPKTPPPAIAAPPA